MFNRIHQKLGTAGFVISIVALVAALGGGAYAASGGLTGKQRKEVEKISKKYAGKPGAKGATGPAGAAGAKGDTGAAGANGTNGSAGTPGQSVTAVHLVPGGGPVGKKCEEGGTELKSASGTEVICNGEEGPEGPQGPAGTTLLPGQTETGVWSFRTVNTAFATVSISFPLRLASGPTFHFLKWSEQGTGAVPGCPSNYSAEPEALPGNFCLYEGEAVSEQELHNSGVPALMTGEQDLTSGFLLKVPLTNPASEAYGGGTWAVAR